MRQRETGQVPTSWTRWWQFNGVGALGVVVQLLVLAVCLTLPGVGREMAVVVAVSSAVIHNFVWHQRWTWRERTGSTSTARLFVRFAATNGLISLVGNVVITSALVSWTGGNLLVANAAAIVVCSVANFILSDRAVFTTPQPGRGGVAE